MGKMWHLPMRSHEGKCGGLHSHTERKQMTGIFHWFCQFGFWSAEAKAQRDSHSEREKK